MSEPFPASAARLPFARRRWRDGRLITPSSLSCTRARVSANVAWGQETKESPVDRIAEAIAGEDISHIPSGVKTCIVM